MIRWKCCATCARDRIRHVSNLSRVANYAVICQSQRGTSCHGHKSTTSFTAELRDDNARYWNILQIWLLQPDQPSRLLVKKSTLKIRSWKWIVEHRAKRWRKKFTISKDRGTTAFLHWRNGLPINALTWLRPVCNSSVPHQQVRTQLGCKTLSGFLTS